MILSGGNEFEREGEQEQLRIAPATSQGAGSISFGRRGGRGSERISGAGGHVGSGAGGMAVTGSAPAGRGSTAVGGSAGAGEMTVTGSAPAGRGSTAVGETGAGGPRASMRGGEASMGAGISRAGSSMASATALGKRPGAFGGP